MPVGFWDTMPPNKDGYGFGCDTCRTDITPQENPTGYCPPCLRELHRQLAPHYHSARVAQLADDLHALKEIV